MPKVVLGSYNDELSLLELEAVMELMEGLGMEPPSEIRTIEREIENSALDLRPVWERQETSLSGLEAALLDEEIDVALLRLDELAYTFHPQLVIAAYIKREDPRFAYVGRTHTPLHELEAGSQIAARHSLTRATLLANYPHLDTNTLQATINEELEQLRQGRYDGIIVEASSLRRLGLTEAITHYLDSKTFLPKAGQGCLVLICRKDKKEIQTTLRKANHSQTELAVRAERELVHYLDEDQLAPIGSLAQVTASSIHMMVTVLSLDGKDLVTCQAHGPSPDALALTLAEEAKRQGADSLIERAKESLWFGSTK